MKKRKIGVVGGGAAGMMAAITAARRGADVTILERNDRLGKKILMTGNGKCNLGNLQLSGNEYYGGNPKWIEKALNCFDTEETIRFFESLGLLIKNKNGYLYPASEQAAVVLDVLRFEIKALGIKIIYDCKINYIKQQENGQILVGDEENSYIYDAVILACGGKAAPKTGSDGSGNKLAKQLGHTLIPCVPALVQLRCREDYCKAVAGVRADASISVFSQNKCIARERGELQLTEYGISGIPVFQLSRIVNYILRENDEVKVSINFLPDYDNDVLEKIEADRRRLKDERTVEEYFTGILNKKLMLLFMKLAGLKGNMPIKQADRAAVSQVYELCRNWELHVIGSNPYDNAQVSAGGVDTTEITDTMESKKIPGIFMAGEMLDVDGKCGGYNLQWAWCSGYLAGCGAAKQDK